MKLLVIFQHVKVDDGVLFATKDKMVFSLGTNYNGRLGLDFTRSTLLPEKVEILCGKNIKTFCCNDVMNDKERNLYQTTVFALTEEGQVY